MSRSYDCADDKARAEGIADAASTVRRGELVVLPTDTVYGIGADAFSPAAVAGLLEAKGRGRDMPPPVLVGSVRAAHALIEDLGTHGQDLIDEFWPGPLTIVCTATQSLSWDLGDTKGTVAVRMPMHPVALELLKEVGPMAVSSANLSGRPAAGTAEDAEAQLGDRVGVYLDAGACAESEPSTIVDLTYAVPRVLRSGAIPIDRLRAVCGTVIGESKAWRRPQGRNAEQDKPDGPAEEAAAPDTQAAAQEAPESPETPPAAEDTGAVNDRPAPGTADGPQAPGAAGTAPGEARSDNGSSAPGTEVPSADTADPQKPGTEDRRP
ncbi:L-threonylcarbamoyladenylate synthase [Nocardiopsis sediminis]|uniref:L-threonylcarbamoyladenylate synthase n=1 Tax=Nocardiopsis sediminis TaxID=1778267 RepID=A0ABV8FG89_9ACTN